jgi:hypothetical protein
VGTVHVELAAALCRTGMAGNKWPAQEFNFALGQRRPGSARSRESWSAAVQIENAPLPGVVVVVFVVVSLCLWNTRRRRGALACSPARPCAVHQRQKPPPPPSGSPLFLSSRPVVSGQFRAARMALTFRRATHATAYLAIKRSQTPSRPTSWTLADQPVDKNEMQSRRRATGQSR